MVSKKKKVCICVRERGSKWYSLPNLGVNGGNLSETCFEIPTESFMASCFGI